MRHLRLQEERIFPLKEGSSPFHTKEDSASSPVGTAICDQDDQKFRDIVQGFRAPLTALDADTDCAAHIWIPHLGSHVCLRCGSHGVMCSAGSHLCGNDKQQFCV